MKSCCGIDSKESNEKSVYSEKATDDKNRIDIWLETDNDIVLIENKIQSAIHCSKTKDNDTAKSQLAVYKEFADKKNENGKNIKCFLLSPDYYDFLFPDRSLRDENWEKLNYSKLKECVDEFSNNNEDVSKKYKMKDYGIALGRHSNKYPLSMKGILLERINNLKD